MCLEVNFHAHRLVVINSCQLIFLFSYFDEFNLLAPLLFFGLHLDWNLVRLIIAVFLVEIYRSWALCSCPRFFDIPIICQLWIWTSCSTLCEIMVVFVIGLFATIKIPNTCIYKCFGLGLARCNLLVLIVWYLSKSNANVGGLGYNSFLGANLPCGQALLVSK